MSSTILNRIQQIASGYSVLSYQEKKYGVTRTDFNNGKSIKLFAKELGGNNFISLNYYLLTSGDQLKPCEMPRSKVLDFLMNYKEVTNF